jgi:two-component sensor histidine kinase
LVSEGGRTGTAACGIRFVTMPRIDTESAAGDASRLRRYKGFFLEFALQALDQADRLSLLQRATECVAAGIDVDRTKILRCRVEEEDLLVIAGVGWKPGVVGHATLPHGMRSPPGRAVATEAPVTIDDLPHDPEYDYSDLLRDHGIISVVNVPIPADGKIWGVLEVDSTGHRAFDADDRDFLSDFARIIGRTIENRRRDEEAQATQRELSIELRERDVLFNELHHRIANQLHAITGALEVARRRTTDANAYAELDKAVGRIASVVATNQQLSIERVAREISLSVYLTRLTEGLARPDNVQIVQTIDDASVPLRVAVRLGLVVNELVTNALKHAFGGEGGRITITFHREPSANVLTVADNGRGLQAPRPGSSGTKLVESLARQIGARLEVNSSTSGTAFMLYLPHATEMLGTAS